MAARTPTWALRPGDRVRVAQVLGRWLPARARRGSVGATVEAVAPAVGAGRRRFGVAFRLDVDASTGDDGTLVLLVCSARETHMMEE